MLSSANSINWGRLVPQIAYYVYSYVELARTEKIEDGGEINIVVPTGNFGNILAAWFIKQMGIPVRRLICASIAIKFFVTFSLQAHMTANANSLRRLRHRWIFLFRATLRVAFLKLPGATARR